jgi:cytochrome c biogenesis protein CcmG/thiol:disulfide interchange protein DsbE
MARTTTRQGTDRSVTVAAGTPARPAATQPAARRRPSRARLVLAALLPIALLAAWAALLATRGLPAAGPQVGDPAPDFALADLDGQPLRLADLGGRPVIVNFWASWCGPCVEEFPVLARALREHREDGLVVVGIVVRDNSEAARGFMTRMDARWPAAMDPGEEVARRFGIYAPPETFFIDAEGTITGRQIGQLTAADLNRHLALVLGKE